MSRAAPQIVDLIFGATAAAPRRRRLPAALATATIAHLALVAWALGSRPSLEHWSAELAARVHADLTHVEMVDLEPPKPLQPPPTVEEPPDEPPDEPPPPPDTADGASETSPPEPAQAPQAKPSPKAAEAPPAAAGKILAADPNAPVDLTDGAFVTGDGPSYAGGVTSTSGRGQSKGGRGSGKTATPSPATNEKKKKKKKKGGKKTRPADDRRAPVQMRPGEWRCAWPREAEGEPIHEEVVVLKVEVASDGRVLGTKLVRDPGRGFGDAALACARAQSELFTPAHDPKGAAIQAWSPPIRVRFYR